MAIKLLAIGGTRQFISTFDPAHPKHPQHDPEAQATIYKLGTLSSRMQGILQDLSVELTPDAQAGDQGVTGNFRGNKSAIETVRFGLKGWEHQVDAEGNEVEFATVTRKLAGETVEVLKESLVSLIPLEVIRELSEEIQSANMMTEGVAKN